MRLATRKAEKNSLIPVDLHITPEKYDALVATRARLKKNRPKLAEEVKRLAEMGDFSENAAYQIAKGRLRGLNSRLDETEYLINHAVIIKHSGGSTVELGHRVTVETNGKQKIYQILGSTETDPERGVISHNSPLGAALLGKRAGELVRVRLNDKIVEYGIVKIE
ncbi:MAG: GreA/GreB family elongation factor [Methanoregula sp.]|jgi:transcription elongation factor GreA|nr:GreA/GreB family elongation factor [Methanoregula sp.]